MAALGYGHSPTAPGDIDGEDRERHRDRSPRAPRERRTRRKRGIALSDRRSEAKPETPELSRPRSPET
jgi:hypothetical protein